MSSSDWRDIMMKVLFIIAFLVNAVFGIIGYFTHSTFFYDSLLGVPLLIGVYYYRKKIITSLLGALFLALGWTFNLAGTVGAYNLYFQGVGWDKLIHIISMLGLSFVTFSYLERITKPGKNKYLLVLSRIMITFFIVEGVGALNEIVEFIGTTYFGIGQGLFGMSNGLTVHNSTFDIFDTQWDMIANTLGFVIWAIYFMIGNIKTALAAVRTRKVSISSQMPLKKEFVDTQIRRRRAI